MCTRHYTVIRCRKNELPPAFQNLKLLSFSLYTRLSAVFCHSQQNCQCNAIMQAEIQGLYKISNKEKKYLQTCTTLYIGNIQMLKWKVMNEGGASFYIRCQTAQPNWHSYIRYWYLCTVHFKVVPSPKFNGGSVSLGCATFSETACFLRSNNFLASQKVIPQNDFLCCFKVLGAL